MMDTRGGTVRDERSVFPDLSNEHDGRGLYVENAARVELAGGQTAAAPCPIPSRAA